MDSKRLKDLLVKTGLVLAGVIFLVSLGGMIQGYSTPAEKVRKVTLANYIQEGRFEIEAYSRPQSSRGNSYLFLRIVESLKILFAYSFEPDQALEEKGKEVEVKAILADQNGKWEKEILLISESQETSNFQLSFPLNWKEFLELGKAIEQELAPEGSLSRGSWYWLTLEAEVKTPGQEHGFVTTLKGKLSPSTLEWLSSFENVERGSLQGVNYWQTASFGYEAKHKTNVLLGPITLSRETNGEKPRLMTPSSFPSAALVEAMDVRFSYQFAADSTIDSLKEEEELYMVLESPGSWNKTFPLNTTQKEGKFTLTVPLDVDNLRKMASDIDKEMGSQPAQELQIILAAKVKAAAKLGSETLDESFEQKFKVIIGKTIQWDKKSALTQNGAIKEEVKEFNELAWQLKRYPWIGLGTSFLILSVLGFIYQRERPRPSLLEREVKQRRKHKEILSEVSDPLQIQEGERVVNLLSLDELVKIANNLGKPILYKTEPTKVTYWILDDSTIHQLTVEEENPEN